MKPLQTQRPWFCLPTNTFHSLIHSLTHSNSNGDFFFKAMGRNWGVKCLAQGRNNRLGGSGIWTIDPLVDGHHNLMDLLWQEVWLLAALCSQAPRCHQVEISAPQTPGHFGREAGALKMLWYIMQLDVVWVAHLCLIWLLEFLWAVIFLFILLFVVFLLWSPVISFIHWLLVHRAVVLAHRLLISGPSPPQSAVTLLAVMTRGKKINQLDGGEFMF